MGLSAEAVLTGTMPAFSSAPTAPGQTHQGGRRVAALALSLIYEAMITTPRPIPKFQSGQLVCHRRYGYRAVVVDVDLSCLAPDEWYFANQTQPDRNQPWYHLLVHGTDTTTYAAQSNLEEDLSAQPVQHPLLEQFFGEFTGTRYVRNQRPWPKYEA